MSSHFTLCSYWQSTQCKDQGSRKNCENYGEGCEIYIALKAGVLPK